MFYLYTRKRNRGAMIQHHLNKMNKKVVGKFNIKGKLYHTIYATAITAGCKSLILYRKEQLYMEISIDNSYLNELEQRGNYGTIRKH